MRLINCSNQANLRFETYFDQQPPRVAILSHTWGDYGDEVTLKEFMKGRGKSKNGYSKTQSCAKQATCDGLQYIWVDTCCIDQSSTAEHKYRL
jgi:hypothetical protein